MPGQDTGANANGSPQPPAGRDRQGSPSWRDARQLAYHCASPLLPVTVRLGDASGRTLTQDVLARQHIPHYASSAMDGWAVNGNAPWTITEAGPGLSPGQASVIATGGLVPARTDAILRKESGQITQNPTGKPVLTINGRAKAGEPNYAEHIRPAGEEAVAGEMLIPAGTVLTPAHIALAAVAGHDELHVQAKPMVAVVLTGSEVVTSGLPAPGQVRDTFGPQLGTVISLLGGTPCSPLRIGDSYQHWLTALGDAGSLPDPEPHVIITTGGTGRSDTDHFRTAIAALGGHLLLDGIAMRPGHPAVLAKLPGDRFAVGLPGNPLAAMMALMTLAEPLLAALAARPLRPVNHVISGKDVDPDAGRTRLIPCRFIQDVAFPVSRTGPGMMRGLAWADAVMAVPPQGVQSGEYVPVVPLPWASNTTTN